MGTETEREDDLKTQLGSTNRGTPGDIAVLNGWQGTESLWHLGGRDSVILCFGRLASRSPRIAASVLLALLCSWDGGGMAYPHGPEQARAWDLL